MTALPVTLLAQIWQLRVASPGCSDRTIRRRLREWAEAGLAEALHALALRHYDRMIGLDLRPTTAAMGEAIARAATDPALPSGQTVVVGGALETLALSGRTA